MIFESDARVQIPALPVCSRVCVCAHVSGREANRLCATAPSAVSEGDGALPCLSGVRGGLNEEAHVQHLQWDLARSKGSICIYSHETGFNDRHLVLRETFSLRALGVSMAPHCCFLVCEMWVALRTPGVVEE